MQLFETLRQIQEELGRVQGLQFAVIGDTDDPLGLGRVQCYDATKGGTLTDWLVRIVPFYGLSLPVPPKGTTTLIGYIDGNAHQGVYFGALSNLINPQQDKESLVIQIGNVTIGVSKDGLNIDGVNTVTINGKEVATIGAKDTRGDDLVTKGW